MRKLAPRLVILLCVGVIAAVIAVDVWEVGIPIIVRGRPATITLISGTVLYSPAGDSHWSTADVGMSLQRGDQLLTQWPDGEAAVQFDDGNIGFILKPDTLITVTAGWNVVLQAGSGGVDLDHGRLVAATLTDAPTAETRFHINTQTTQVSIEGTWLVVQTLKGEPTTLITSLEGDVRVRATAAEAAIYRPDAQRLPERETMIKAGETLIVYVEPPAAPMSGNLGRVVDPLTGNGYGGAVVQVVGHPELFEVTGEDGYFGIQGAALNSELVLIGATETGSGELELRPDVGQAAGRVVDGVTGEGIAQAKITPVGRPELATETGSDGSFAIQELGLGTHSLAISADGHIDVIATATVGAEVWVVIPDIPLVPQNSLVPWAYLPFIVRDWGQYP